MLRLTLWGWSNSEMWPSQTYIHQLQRYKAAALIALLTWMTHTISMTCGEHERKTGMLSDNHHLAPYTVHPPPAPSADEHMHVIVHLRMYKGCCHEPFNDLVEAHASAKCSDSCESTALKDRTTGEKGPVTELELRTYALSWSFSYMSHRSQSRSFGPNRPLVPVMGVLLSNGRLRPMPRGWHCVQCGGRGSYFHLRLVDFMQHASHRWACYYHTVHSTSLEAQVLSGRWIAAHPWPVLKGDWGRRISTGIDGSHGWNSAIERRSQVRARSLVLFPLSPYPSELWIHNYLNKSLLAHEHSVKKWDILRNFCSNDKGG